MPERGSHHGQAAKHGLSACPFSRVIRATTTEAYDVEWESLRECTHEPSGAVAQMQPSGRVFQACWLLRTSEFSIGEHLWHDRVVATGKRRMNNRAVRIPPAGAQLGKSSVHWTNPHAWLEFVSGPVAGRACAREPWPPDTTAKGHEEESAGSHVPWGWRSQARPSGLD